MIPLLLSISRKIAQFVLIISALVVVLLRYVPQVFNHTRFEETTESQNDSSTLTSVQRRTRAANGYGDKRT